MGRALLWLLLGLLALVLLVVATAPELVGGDPGGTSVAVLVVLLAGLPGLAVIAVVALRRRGRRPPDSDDPRDAASLRGPADLPDER